MKSEITKVSVRSLDYFYCGKCGCEFQQEECEACTYTYTAANGDVYRCPTCGGESIGETNEDARSVWGDE